jgi:hypothetical protein
LARSNDREDDLMKTMLLMAMLILPGLLYAVERPDMTSQKTWTDAEKDAFYQWLQDQHGRVPAADSRQLVITPAQTIEARQRVPGNLSDRYLSARLASYDVRNFLRRADGSAVEPGGGGDEAAAATELPAGEMDGDLMGFELQLGKPIKTWFRRLYTVGYYRGSTDWALADDVSADFSMIRLGGQLELALVPLGLDQTRNILLRGGLDLLYARKGQLTEVVDGDIAAATRHGLEEFMLEQVTGWHTGVSWAVGYERQLGENFWRVHGVIDGFQAVHLPRDDDREDWSTLGLGLGISRVF